MNKTARIWRWAIVVLIAALAIVIAFYFDDAVRHWIVQHRNRSVNRAMQTISKLGDWPEHIAAGLIGAGIAWWRGSKRWVRICLTMIAALSVAGVIGYGMKIAVGRARPSVKQETTWEGPRLSSKYHSFPSGHTVATSAFFGVLLFANWRAGLCFLPIPIAIAFSRMYVAAHYLSDVVCAAIIGLLCAGLLARFYLNMSRSAVRAA